jgi:glutathione synthase/RimK-type ligase-like ATP-grasp enzyme
MRPDKFHFAAISRGQKYSPNHVENDSFILNNTIHELIVRGHKVSIYHEDEIKDETLNEKFIFTMIRGSHALGVLQKAEKRGCLVLNGTAGVLNCYREFMAMKLPEANIPFPRSLVVDTDNPDIKLSDHFESTMLWVKRGDVHAIHREDVTLVHSEGELFGIIREYARRGIQKAVIQEHLEGAIVKFYAVNGSEFFHWYYHNGSKRLAFDPEYLHHIAVASARTLGVDIYGGDAVVGIDGSVRIIDLNDWPSFAPVRDAAAYHIANLIEKKSYEFAIQQNTLKMAQS